ncbi:MAG: hypothetical protein NTX73_13395 [Rhodobacterales bacterium]|nr:hypothetical protein [Rhodobacterales bacterium]
MGQLDLRGAILRGAVPQFTCLAGTMLQETCQTAPQITAASYASVAGHARTRVADFAAAIAARAQPDCPPPPALPCTCRRYCRAVSFWPRGREMLTRCAMG